MIIGEKADDLIRATAPVPVSPGQAALRDLHWSTAGDGTDPRATTQEAVGRG
jgi:hypothetical protein